VNEVLVHHYVLDLDVNFNENCVDGNILLFVKPANENVALQNFQLCLDCTLIDILFAKEVKVSKEFNFHFQSDFSCCTSSKEVGKKPEMCSSCHFLQSYNNIDEGGACSVGVKDNVSGNATPSIGKLSRDSKHVNDLNYKKLSYATYGWCVRIWKERQVVEEVQEWPKCVWIRYKTKPSGPSLMWCKDQDEKPCCFTPGAFINNRSMMPCQEPPVAMATWQATIKLPKDMVALSSGALAIDKENCLRQMFSQENKDLFYFEMIIPLPSSTLAFAFGYFTKSSKTISCKINEYNQNIDVTLYATDSIIKGFEDEYLELSASYLHTTCKTLGRYPFNRLDIVVMPTCFACMGLSSPNIVFLSQSVLCGDRSMSTRIAHEISHAWFGLLVGAKDWTEEWLSEGFATYIEDRIVGTDKGMNEEDFLSYSVIMQLLRFKTLQGEIQQTDDENLKLLRPQKKTNYMTAIEAVDQSRQVGYVEEVRPFTVVPNAAIASKKILTNSLPKGLFFITSSCKTCWC